MCQWVTQTFVERFEGTDISYFVDLYDEFAKLNNFNGMAAVFGGLRSAFDTDKAALQSLNRSHKKFYEDMKTLFCSHYRDTFEKSPIPCVPFVVALEEDLCQLIKTDPPIFDRKLKAVAFERCQLIAEYLTEIRRRQVPYTQKETIPLIQKWLTLVKANYNPSSTSQQEPKAKKLAISFGALSISKLSWSSDSNSSITRIHCKQGGKSNQNYLSGPITDDDLV